MFKTVLQLVFLQLFVATSFAQVIPVENDTLNYRLVGFSVPASPKIPTYRFEIAEGIINNNTDFQKNISLIKESNTNRLIEIVPSFGKAYTWRVRMLNKKGKTKAITPLYHFITGTSVFVDTTMYRVRIIDSAAAYKDLLIFYDNTRTLRDMNGIPLWYLPNIPSLVNENATIRDLKLTPQGTITFLMGSSAVEVDYHGKVLWKAPNDGSVSHDTSEYYHHEFTRLPGGNYMVAAIQYVSREIPAFVDTNAYIGQWNVEKKGNKFYNKIPFGTVIEYDSQGKVVWYWSSASAFTDEDLFAKSIHNKIMTSTHPNSFYFDSSKQVLYTSFRDANMIIKTKYTSGEVLAKYGKNLNPDKPEEPGLFATQHNCRINADGDIYLFNNNAPLRGTGTRPETKTSSVEILKEPDNATNELVKVWEFPCNIDTFALSGSTGGGSVYELSDKSILVSMGVINRNFIVTRDKKILWNTLTQMKPRDRNSWLPHDNYRISPIETPRQLERLIFN